MAPIAAVSWATPYDGSPTSSLVAGKGLGTDYGMNPDGSTESYALGGDNGKYPHPVKTTIQPWDLRSTVEPDPNVIAIQERLAHQGLRKRHWGKNSEINLCLQGEPIMAEVFRLKKRVEKLMCDRTDSDDIVIEGKSTFRDWILQQRR